MLLQRGLGGLLALRMTAEGPAAQREAPATDEVGRIVVAEQSGLAVSDVTVCAVLQALVTTASSSGAMIDRATSDMVVRYIFATARTAPANVQRFCHETEQARGHAAYSWHGLRSGHAMLDRAPLRL